MQRSPDSPVRRPGPVPWLVLGIALLATLAWWSFRNYDRTRAASQRHAEQAAEVARRFEERLAALDQVARSAAAMLAHAGPFTQTRWRDYVAAVGLAAGDRFGAAGLGFAPRIAAEVAALHEKERRLQDGGFLIWPESREAWRYPIQMLSTTAEQDASRILGFDLYSEPVRRAAIDRAVAEQRVVMSDPLYLRAGPPIGEAGKASPEPEPSWLFIAPVARTGELEPSGIVVAAVRIRALLNGLSASPEAPAISVELPGRPEGQALVVATRGEGRLTEAREHTVRHGDRTFRLRVSPAHSPESRNAHWESLALGLAGSVVLFLLAWGLESRWRDSARREASARAQAETRFRSLAAAAPFLVWTTDADMNVTFLNAWWTRLTGATPASGHGRGWMQFVDPEDHERIAGVLADAVQGETAFSFHGRLRSPDGRSRWMIVNGEPARDADGKCVGFVGAGLDVHDIQTAAEERERMAGLFSELLNAVPAPMSVKDEQHRFVLVNDALLRTVGLEADQLVGRTDVEIFGDAGLHYQQRDREALASREPIRYEAKYVGPGSAKELHASVMKTTLVRGDGTRLLVTVMLDISEQARLSRALEDQRRLLDAVLNALPFPVAAKSAEHRFLMINDACLELNGWRRDEVLGRAEQELRPGPVADRMVEQDDLVLSTGRPWRGEEPYTSGDGRALWTFKTKTPVTLADGRAAVVIAQLDLTQRREAELALERERAFLDAVLEGVPAIVFVTDEAHRNLRLNAHGERFLGRDRSEILGRTDAELGHDAGRAARNAAEDDAVFASGCEMAFEEEVEDGAGRLRWLHKRKMPVSLSSGERLILGVALDVTDERRQTEELTQSRARLAVLADLSRRGLDGEPLQACADAVAAHVAQTHAGVTVTCLDVTAGGGIEVCAASGDGRVRWHSDGRETPCAAARALLSAGQTDGLLLWGDVAAETPPELAARLEAIGSRAHLSLTVSVAGDRSFAVCIDSTVPLEWLAADVQWVRDIATALATVRESERARRARDEALVAAEDSRAFLDAIIDALPQPVFVKDREHRLRLVNRALCEWWGLPRDRLLGRADHELLPAAAEETLQEDEEVFERGKVVVRDAVSGVPGGPSHWVTVRKAPLRTSRHGVWLVGSLSPIDALKAAQERAEGGERFLSSLLDAIPMPIVAKDESGRILLANVAYLELSGRPRDEVIGRTDREVYGDEEGGRYEAEDRAVLTGARTEVVEDRVPGAAGGARWYLKSKRSMIDPSGRRIVLVSGLDITERKRAEIHALATGRRLALLHDVASAVVAGDSFEAICDRALHGLRDAIDSCEVTWWRGLDDRPLRRELATAPRPGASPIAADMAPEPQPLVVDGAGSEPPFAAALLDAEGASALIACPVSAGGGMRGWIVVASARARTWQTDQVDTVCAVAAALAGALAAVRSRAEREAAEAEVRRSRAVLHTVLNALPHAVYVKDEDGRWIVANEAFCRVAVRTMDEVIGHTTEELYSPELAARLRAQDREAFERDGPMTFEQEASDPRSPFARQWKTKTPVTMPDGRRYLVCTVVDITDMKRAQIETERAKRFLQAVLDATPVAVFVKDEAGRMVVVNEAAGAMLGRRPETLVGLRDADVHEADYAGRIETEDREAFRNEQPRVTEVLAPLPGAGPTWVLKRKAAVTLPDGSRYLIAAILDIDDRRRSEEELRQSRCRLEVQKSVAMSVTRGAALVETLDLATASLSRAVPDVDVSFWAVDGAVRTLSMRTLSMRTLGPEGDAGRTEGASVVLDDIPDYVQALRDGDAVEVTDCRTDPRVRAASDRLEGVGGRSFLDAPVRAPSLERLWGVVSLSSDRPRSWSEHERRLAVEIAEVLALAHLKVETERERDRVERELRASEDTLRATVWASDIGLWTWDLRTSEVRFSDQYKGQLGLAPEEFPDAFESWSARLHPDDLEFALACVQRALDSDAQRMEIEFRMRHKDGTWRNMLSRAQVRRDPDGAPLSMIGGHIDVTEFRRAQEALRRHGETLEQLVAERTGQLKAAKELAEAANQAKSEFLANMSHELRTPMHAILSFSRLGLDKAAGEPQAVPKIRQYFERIRQSGDRLLTLLNDLLDLSKLEAGKMTYAFDRCDLRAVADTVVLEHSALARERGVMVRLEAEGSVPAWCDGARVMQVVRNLVSNAVKFTPGGGTVRVCLGVSGLPDGRAAALVEVIDQGVGIPEEELESVFDKFVQSSKTKSGAGGTGLGLAICREIVAGHGGCIWASNNPDGGAAFRVLLPREPFALESGDSLPITDVA